MNDVSIDPLTAKRCEDGTFRGWLIAKVVDWGYAAERNLPIDELLNRRQTQRQRFALRVANWIASLSFRPRRAA